MTTDTVTLAPAHPDDLPAFKRELQEAFAIAVVAEFGALPDGPIPSDDDLDATLAHPGAVVLRIRHEGRAVGGAVVTIDRETHRNALDLFFISPGAHGRGLGRRAWFAIERHFPQTRVWETHTPYFEKRNIHFYVNVCGFRIVEFFSPHHPNPHGPGQDDLPGDGEAFRFEKVM
ncbi:GNAT family N-acetyltransferase [uncultured Methylobacterium sp.]|uniref:GNAT family N-acetyltransferase n=1 Tax=uncultured Methylobacterium sp. TaxID=157278 RepID=UPI002590B362|nr:GNAT family N-acetyltransferase [uncultured Methylobacterium sp.]